MVFSMGSPISLFRSLEVFESSYLPENYLYRGDELKEIFWCLQPLLRGQRGSHVKIYGEPATGKTTAVNKVFTEIREISQRVTCACVNARINSSKLSIFARIYKELYGHDIPERGVAYSTIYRKIFSKLRREKKSLIVALDDINYLAHSRELCDIIYELTRSHEDGYDVNVALIAVSSSPSFNFDSKVRSCFNPVEVCFRPYTLEEKTDILGKRAEAGFGRGVASRNVVEYIAGIAHDLRQGIEFLRLAGKEAEKEGCTRLTHEHVDKASLKLGSGSSTALLRTLAKEEVFLYKRMPATSGELYDAAKKEGLNVKGTIGVIQEAVKKGVILGAEARGLLGMFKGAPEDYWIDPAVIDAAIKKI